MAATARWLRSASGARKVFVRAAFLKLIQTQASTARSSSRGRTSAEQGQRGLVVLLRPGRQVSQSRVGGVQPADDPVHGRSERMRQEFFAAGEVVADRPDRQVRFGCDFAQRRPFQTVRSNDPEDGFNYFLAPDCGVDEFWHLSF